VTPVSRQQGAKAPTGLDSSTASRTNGNETRRAAPQSGDSHQDFAKTKQGFDNLPQIQKSAWVCPQTKGKP
jgi:hypothetical protein